MSLCNSCNLPTSILWHLLTLFFCTHAFGEGQIFTKHSLKYEYRINHKQSVTNETASTPLIICIPGFTETIEELEISTLKTHWYSNGFSYLLVNPPQHHSDSVTNGKWYSWGEKEAEYLFKVFNYHKLKKVHGEIHLIGFSIGAKIALRFAAMAEISDQISSVVAVSTPYRVSDIDFMLSGDIRKVPEGLIASVKGIERIGLKTVLHTVLFGMPLSLAINKESPGNEITRINCPTLLIHGSDDWLTRSYHSVKLFNRARDESQFAVLILNTRTHSLDILSRDSADLRSLFIGAIDEWFHFLQQKNLPQNKHGFNHAFQSELDSTQNKFNHLLYPVSNVASITTGTYRDLSTDLWYSPPGNNHSLVTINANFESDRSIQSRLFLTVGDTKNKLEWVRKFRWGMEITKPDSSKYSANNQYFSLYHPFGSFLLFRRATIVLSLRDQLMIKATSLDFTLLLFDLQLSHGKFNAHFKDWHLLIDFPLIVNGSSSYIIGANYGRLLTNHAMVGKRDGYKLYAFYGPKLKVFNSRVQFSVQYDSLWNEGNRDSRFTFGVSLNIKEFQ